ncbi:CinA family protein [Pleionea sediminis]|uniref:CinA family protein n=1 Tax=Pleionea sediminis TaxID=2569479 RepID=UPI001186BCB2|nr:CinA family protein [Pleionea sediminis]
MLNNLTELVTLIAEHCEKNNHMIATAESCTGGLIAKTLTDFAGSSGWFDSGFITYSNRAKHIMLGVDIDIIESQGAVSQSVVEAMCRGAILNSTATLAVAVSGVAGPGGGSAEKPVGTVWVGWQRKNEEPNTRCYHFSGDRAAVREQTLLTALNLYIEMAKFPVEKD